MVVVVTLMNEEPADAAGAAVHVLVAAPGGEVGAPVVQRQLEVARCVRQVEADDAACGVSCTGDRLHVESLTGVIVNAAKEHEGDLVTFSLKQRFDVLLPKTVLTRARLQLDDRFGGVQPVEPSLAGDGVAVGRKG